MSTGRIKYPENFLYDAGTQTWRCLRCTDTSMHLTTWRAAEHEKTAKHERIVQRYIDNLNAANRSQSSPSGVHRAASSTEYATNPCMDAIYDAARAQRSLPRVAPSYTAPDSPPTPTLMDVDYGDNLPAPVPAPIRKENRRIRAAVDSAIKAYLDSSIIDASDSDDSGGDTSERPAVYDQGHIGPGPHRQRRRARVGTGPWRPWPDRTVSISVKIVFQR